MLRHKVDQLTRFDFAHGVRRYTGSNLHFVAIDGSQHNRRSFELVFELVHGLAQAFSICAFELGRQNFHPFDVDGLCHQLIALCRRHFAFERRHFFF